MNGSELKAGVCEYCGRPVYLFHAGKDQEIPFDLVRYYTSNCVKEYRMHELACPRWKRASGKEAGE